MKNSLKCFFNILLKKPSFLPLKIYCLCGRKIRFKKRDMELFKRCIINKKCIRIGGKLDSPLERLIDEKSGDLIDVDAVQELLKNKKNTTYVSDATVLEFAKSEEFDFVCNSHVLEHLTNPIKAILEWKRVLRKGGVIYCAIPDKRFTFDHKRTCTSLNHLIKDYEKNISPKDTTHLDDFLEKWDEKWDCTDRQPLLKIALKNSAVNVHHHVWTKKDIKKLFEYLDLKILMLKLKGNTIHIIGEKK